MIVETLMRVVYSLFSLLTTPIQIPSLPESVHDILSMVLGYIGTGGQILAAYTDLGYLVSLFVVVVGVDAGMLIYKLVMWIIKKIPMLGIE